MDAHEQRRDRSTRALAELTSFRSRVMERLVQSVKRGDLPARIPHRRSGTPRSRSAAAAARESRNEHAGCAALPVRAPSSEARSGTVSLVPRRTSSAMANTSAAAGAMFLDQIDRPSQVRGTLAGKQKRYATMRTHPSG